MEGIKEIEVDGKRIFLKRGKLFKNYRIIYPNKIDGKINWKNLLIGGSWTNLLKLTFILIFIAVLAFSYYHDQKEFRNLLENPCEYMVIAQQRCAELEGFFVSPLNPFGNVEINTTNENE